MSSDQADLAKDTANGGGKGGPPKPFPRSPLEYGSSLLGAGSPSYEARISFKRFHFLPFALEYRILTHTIGLGKYSSRRVFLLFFGRSAELRIVLRVKRLSSLQSPKVFYSLSSLMTVDIPSTESSPSVRRARAGTVPSRFTNPLEELANLSIQPHASSSTDLPAQANPIPPAAVTPARPSYQPPVHPSSAAARLRSGSLTLPRALYQNPSTPFGPSIFSSSYHQRHG